MINVDVSEYDFGNNTSLIDNNEDEYKEYLEEMETDYWVNEYKNNPIV